MEKYRILVADDDRDIANLIADSLEDEGYEVIKAYNGRDALKMISSCRAGLVILDIMMPGMDGLEVCRIVRNEVRIPIILLSARNSETDKIIGLEMGADDYITKPFSINELTARVKAHMRREMRSTSPDREAPNTLLFENLAINRETLEVFKDDVKIDLSTKEFQILAFLAENRNRVLSKEQIYSAVWGNGDYGDINTVTVHIRNIRSKLDRDNRYIKTVWGIGYKFVGGLL